MTDISDQKEVLRKRLRKERRAYADALPPATSRLIFHRPPGPILERIPQQAPIGLYRASHGEAPASGYARYFAEAGHVIALPRIGESDEPMVFHQHVDPFGESDLVKGPLGLMQPEPDATIVEPTIIFVPLVGFTAEGARLGQGGGYYDRWLVDHTDATPFGLAWDNQLVEELPVEDHDMPLAMVITPTRIFGPFG